MLDNDDQQFLSSVFLNVDDQSIAQKIVQKLQFINGFQQNKKLSIQQYSYIYITQLNFDLDALFQKSSVLCCCVFVLADDAQWIRFKNNNQSYFNHENYYFFPLKSIDNLQLIVQQAQLILSLKIEQLSNQHKGQPERVFFASEIMLQQLEQLKQITELSAPVFLYGETGVGKAFIARFIHDHSSRTKAPFVTINCAATYEHSIGEILFGEEILNDGKIKTRLGKLDQANGGTLLLKSVSELPLSIQQDLADFMQSGFFKRKFSNEPIFADVRIIATDLQGPKKIKNQPNIDADFFQMMNHLCFHIPPLRERSDDVLLLAQFFLTSLNQQLQKNITGFSKEAMIALQNYSWRGNVRELQNKIKSAVIMTDQNKLTELDLSLTSTEKITDDLEILTLREVREQAEQQILLKAIDKAQGNVSLAAKLLKISRPSIYALIKKYAILDQH